MSAQTVKLTALAMLISIGAASVAFAEPKQTVKQLKNCGSEASNSFGAHKEYPILNEGNGYIGIKTADQDANGTKLRYTLVNCANRQVVRVDAEYKLTDSSKGVPGGDLFDFVDGLRKESRLANERVFTERAQSAGYPIIAGKLAPYGETRARRADCGCMTYYSDLMPYTRIP
ncbi:hypothetical protein [Paracoccus pacificus]|uniref:Uncharacterized protein n=1 Tax=Paracoccus pacificus TaxID=1463598 RepID=A0ABW4RCP3_9RHOB